MNVLNVIQKSEIGAVVAVAAGKGGVGKSTVSVNLALALRDRGVKVGLLDADIYGPSLQQMLPQGVEPSDHPDDPDRLLPGVTLGMPFVSVAHFKKKASAVRAPIANRIIEQFLSSVEWGELDYLIVDFPPGTGDVQLTLMQKASLAGALVVTTPQRVATLDVRKAIELFQAMHVPVIGVVENMSYWELPSQEKCHPFGSGGAEQLAKEFSLPLLGQIPIDPAISELGDSGGSLFEEERGRGVREIFRQVARAVAEKTSHLPKEVGVRQSGSPHHLEFCFDGTWKAVALHELQLRCPCARCARKKKSQEDVSALEFSKVGRYAVKIAFSSGCSQGVFPFALIQKLV